MLVTHFEYYTLRDTLLKFDLLGHDNPTMLGKLQAATGVDVKDISRDDKAALKLLIDADTRGVPEFRSPFIRGIINAAQPKTFDDFVQIYGLSHGANAWTDNADKLISDGTATIAEVIALRDDIMVYLMDKGLDRETSCKTMENIGMGKGLSKSHKKIMSNAGIPSWYIASCEKIQYLFPKAHAVSYTLMAYRIAWFKAHHPAAFYKAYFEVMNDCPEVDYLSMDIRETKRQIALQIAKSGADTSAEVFGGNQKLEHLKMRLEMLNRKIRSP